MTAMLRNKYLQTFLRNGQVRYELKTPWRNGTTHVVFEPLDFIARLVGSECGGDVKIIASIEDPAVIQKILAHLDDNTPCVTAALQPECRAPPLAELLESF